MRHWSLPNFHFVGNGIHGCQVKIKKIDAHTIGIFMSQLLLTFQFSLFSSSTFNTLTRLPFSLIFFFFLIFLSSLFSPHLTSSNTFFNICTRSHLNPLALTSHSIVFIFILHLNGACKTSIIFPSHFVFISLFISPWAFQNEE